jgi:hypothetical protein
VILVTVAAVGVVAGVLGLVVAMAANARTSRVVDECARMIRSRLQASAANPSAATASIDDRALRDLAIVHYDALTEMSGQMSFSLAMLNAAGDGVMLTSINGRSETRTYAKVIEGGRAVQPLSPEEDRVLRAARLGQGPRVSRGPQKDSAPSGPPGR